MTCRFASARFWLIITKVDRKIASSETIIVTRPKGYFPTPSPIHSANHKTWMYTKVIDPANAVILSETLFWTSWARSCECFTSAGLSGGGSGRGTNQHTGRRGGL